MYVCLCNPFTDKDVQKALEAPEIRNTPAQIYKACAGTGPNCGSCLCTVKSMIVDHQSALGVQKIIEELPVLSESETIAAE
ncbi:MAG: hypothetical protein DI551_02680 [Micavibrio aeruginosavorus]|uniref:Bacterioferritin-associated ferredoxin n=1 Tax=Micavibrio aeruginosavorus TaxID=349221 RepID=A0A2W5PT28_9BACT|nr:MAG: hypothetical protein DI551_02680 [Micavibrio aeruginosavorus]